MNDSYDKYIPPTVPDNGVFIASKREVNRGCCYFMGDRIDPQDIAIDGSDPDDSRTKTALTRRKPGRFVRTLGLTKQVQHMTIRLSVSSGGPSCPVVTAKT